MFLNKFIKNRSWNILIRPRTFNMFTVIIMVHPFFGQCTIKKIIIIASAPTSYTFTLNNRRNCVLGVPYQLKMSAPTSVIDIGMTADRIKQTMGSLKPVSIENPLSVNFLAEGASSRQGRLRNSTPHVLRYMLDWVSINRKKEVFCYFSRVRC